MLNLAMTDKVNGGWATGRIYNLIGDSAAGKSILAWTGCATLCNDEKFADYDVIYDDAEHALAFNVRKLFGRKTEDRVRPPSGTRSDPENSSTIEQLYRNVMAAISSGVPFFYVCDSFDALSCEAELARAQEVADGKTASSSYKTEKAKLASEYLRTLCSKLEGSKSVLLIISQTRVNLNPLSFEKKTRSGGAALRFYSSHEIWLAAASKEKRKKRTIGGNTVAKVTKNKITGKLRTVNFPIFYDVGVDDIGSCINFLVDEGHWSSSKSGRIEAEEFEFSGTHDKLIRHIEDNDLERKLRRIVGKVWNAIEESIALNRKPRFE